MGILHSIFTWWDGATIGTRLFSWRRGQKVGSDGLGNAYFEDRKNPARRWVMYQGANDAARVPPEWWGWLHGTFDGLPDEVLPPTRTWQQAATGNLTGTAAATRPAGALEEGGVRPAATGDYQAWTPS